jgi:predicted metal-dependent HD superfamily phosphohydrolase
MITPQQVFIETAKSYTTNSSLIEKLWIDIEKQYSGKKRYYHKPSHLENLYAQLSAVKTQVLDWDTLMFSLFYHDVVYNVLKHDNEEKSAALAGKRLVEINVPAAMVEKCQSQILATKAHTISAEKDTNLFIDADLSILGQPADVYKTYCAQVRKEYSVYPDVIYNPGRKKVLAHFLQMERIFKTTAFYEMFEQQTRLNIKAELERLSL